MLSLKSKVSVYNLSVYLPYLPLYFKKNYYKLKT